MTFNGYQRESSRANDYLYNGKERQDELELGWMDYGARMYTGELGRWGVMDSHADLFVVVTPYSYSLNNPISLRDPDGQKVKPTNEAAFRAIVNTLTAEDAAFVRLKRNGMIDRRLINKRKSDSGNFNALKEMVNDRTLITVTVGSSFTYIDSDGKGQCADLGEVLIDKKEVHYPSGQELSTGEFGWLGQTLARKKDKDAAARSKNNSIQIYLNDGLTEKGQAEAVSHELYGHAYFRVKGRDSRHNIHILYDTDSEGNQTEDIFDAKELNFELHKQIVDRKHETLDNFQNKKAIKVIKIGDAGPVDNQQ